MYVCLFVWECYSVLTMFVCVFCLFVCLCVTGFWVCVYFWLCMWCPCLCFSVCLNVFFCVCTHLCACMCIYTFYMWFFLCVFVFPHEYVMSISEFCLCFVWCECVLVVCQNVCVVCLPAFVCNSVGVCWWKCSRVLSMSFFLVCLSVGDFVFSVCLHGWFCMCMWCLFLCVVYVFCVVIWIRMDAVYHIKPKISPEAFPIIDVSHTFCFVSFTTFILSSVSYQANQKPIYFSFWDVRRVSTSQVLLRSV